MERTTAVALALLGLAGAAQAQVPAGPEFRVNENTLGTQFFPDVAFQPDGGFVVVWAETPSDGSSLGVRARRYEAGGAPVGAAFQVNTYTTGIQQVANGTRSVAADSRGRFVVAWTSLGQDGSGAGVFARRFDVAGAPLGPEFQVNTYTTDDQTGIAVAMAAGGGFVVTWDSMGQDGSLSGVFARRFDAGGNPLGAEFQVNQFTTSGQLAPSVAMATDGFVVAWMSGQDGSGNSVHARRFDGQGLPLAGEFRVNTTTLAGQTFPVVASMPAGFVVSWESDAQDGSADGIYAQRFDAAGALLGAEFKVNTYTTGRQAFPAIVTDHAGRFVIAWESAGQDGGGYGVHGQRFDAQGVARGGEFRINSTTAGDQINTRPASDAYGNLAIAWDGPDGNSLGAFAQRYGGLRPASLSVTDGANGVLEVPEDFALVTAWRNVSGSPQAIQGRLLPMPVPPGLIVNLSTTADYGIVPDGAVNQCSPCFSGSIMGTRPTGHYDLPVTEMIEPDAQGQVALWRVHLGDSFFDVPRSNPFYRFIETLLHHEITSGCGSNVYCPGSSTTREQMSVFVLVAKEGGGYAPPACTTPVFEDVPASSPFCRWIEELARRGVVSGCAPGRYCPGDAVTREQMSVFVLRTLDPALDPPACVPGAEMFDDVPASSVFCRWIEELARRDVVSGCGGGNYCPVQPVTREQMGVFIGLTFGLGLYGP